MLNAAGAQQFFIGYCDDELASGLHPVGLQGLGDTRISAAIHMPRTRMVRYEGMTITRLRFAVRSGLKNVSVWIRTSLTSSSVVVQSVPEVSDGWNEVELRSPYTIDGSDLYIGYTATQPEGYEGILAYGEGSELTSWLAVGNEWADYHEMGLGILYIQAVAEGTMKEREAVVLSVETDRMLYADGSQLAVSGEVENLSASPLEGYTLSYAIDGTQVATQTVNGLLQPDATASFSHAIDLPVLSEGRHELAVSIAGDQRATDFYVYASSYPRMVLLEHFTSLNCVNCPPVDHLIEQVVEGRQDVAWVTHRVGYRDDEFTLEDSRQLTRFGVAGNPYVMLDRTSFTDGEPPAFTLGGYDAEQVGYMFDYAASMPSFVSLQAATTVADGGLTIDVVGEGKAFVSDLYPRATLHVYLIEDAVEAVGTQAGDANKKVHDNILRRFVTPVRGQLPAWSADGSTLTFSATLQAELAQEWVTDHLRVVAFMVNQAPTGSGYPSGQVLNTVEARVGHTSGVRSLVATQPSDALWTTVDGRHVVIPRSKGLYIHNGRKCIIK